MNAALRIRLWRSGLAMLLATLSCITTAQASATPRVVVMSDFPPPDVIPVKACGPYSQRGRCSDPDDIQSMVRLLYANEFDLEGLIASAGTPANRACKQPLLDLLDLYAQVQPRLAARDPRYPTADRLKQHTWQGLDGAWVTARFGSPARPLSALIEAAPATEASTALIDIVDRPDPRPVWVLCWGGSREVAQAVRRVRETRDAAALARFVGKLRLYLVAKQDGTADWLIERFPELFIMLTEKNYMARFSQSGPDTSMTDMAWLDRHFRAGHGPLGAAYPASGWDPAHPGQQEGDSPSFLHLISGLRGINDPERPDQPGWGGKLRRAAPDRHLWIDDPDGARAILAGRSQMQREFAERAAWMGP